MRSPDAHTSYHLLRIKAAVYQQQHSGDNRADQTLGALSLVGFRGLRSVGWSIQTSLCFAVLLSLVNDRVNTFVRQADCHLPATKVVE